MNVRFIGSFLLAALLAASLGPQPVFANRPAGEQIAGVLSAVNSDGHIVVEGKSFHVKSGSPAASALASLTPGSMVTVLLDGPLGKSSSQVINISVRSGNN